jgi:hypothetical protein
MVWSHVPTGSPLLRVSQIRAPTLRGQALCHILETICTVVEFRRLSLWMKSMIPGGLWGFLAFWYPLLEE